MPSNIAITNENELLFEGRFVLIKKKKGLNYLIEPNNWYEIIRFNIMIIIIIWDIMSKPTHGQPTGQRVSDSAGWVRQPPWDPLAASSPRSSSMGLIGPI